MKHSFGKVVLPIVFVFTLYGCSKDNSIVDTWTMKTQREIHTVSGTVTMDNTTPVAAGSSITFKDNGQYSITQSGKTNTGTYQLTGSRLTMCGSPSICASQQVLNIDAHNLLLSVIDTVTKSPLETDETRVSLSR